MWQKIETAPRDWTEVLVFSPEHDSFNSGGVFSAFYGEGQWRTHMPGGNMLLNATHWMPLPTPPTAE
jgi:hypothetical protein